MQKITISILLALILSLITRGMTGVVEVENTTSKLVRLHVVANSDSEEDQSEKLEVRDAVLAYVSELTSEVASKSEAVDLITSHIEEITEVAEAVTSLRVTVSYENVLVDRREYDDFTLPEGYYDALCVFIGEAEGKNWWCVLYPSLCVSGAISIDDCEVLDDDDLIIISEPEKVQYKLFCFELWQKVKSFFSDSTRLVERG
ncbi:MAG: stage II sporulation protein R [Oscillospiraceae bacterium]|nr:stage II sporulation protein R [Oscillospiraceae bacterium]